MLALVGVGDVYCYGGCVAAAEVVADLVCEGVLSDGASYVLDDPVSCVWVLPIAVDCA